MRHYGLNWYVPSALREYDDEKEHYDLPLEIEPDNPDLLKKKAFTLFKIGL